MAFLTVSNYVPERLNFATDSTRLVEASVGAGTVGGQSFAARRTPGRRSNGAEPDYTGTRAAAFAEDGEIRRGMYIDRTV